METVCVTLESESAWQGWGAGAQSLPDNKAANYGKTVPPALSSMVAATGAGAKERPGAGKICLQDNKAKNSSTPTFKGVVLSDFGMVRVCSRRRSGGMEGKLLKLTSYLAVLLFLMMASTNFVLNS